jgi:hypothetical protein
MDLDLDLLEYFTIPGLVIDAKAANPATGLTVGFIIGEILPWIYAAIGLVLLFYLIMAGFQFMTSGGDPKAAEGAKKKITNAIIGFLIVFVSYWIVVVLSEVLDIWQIRHIF